MSRVHAVRQKQLVPRQGAPDRPVPGPDRRPGPGLGRRPRRWSTGPPARRGRWPRRVMEKTVGPGVAAAAAALRQAALHHVVQEAAEVRAAAPTGGRNVSRSSPPASWSTWSPTWARPSSRSTSTTAWPAALPEGTKCCGAPWLHSGNVERIHQGGPAQRGGAGRRGAGRAGRHRGPAHLCLRGEAGLPDLRQGPRGRARGRAHLRPGRVPDAAPPRRRRRLHPARRVPRSGRRLRARARHLPRGLPPAGPERRAAQPGPAQGGRACKCTLVQRCSGIDGTWGYRAENYELARKVAAPLGREIEAAGNDVVCGDCHLANGSILQETGTQPVHPMQLMARAYGMGEPGRGRRVSEPGRGRRRADPGRRARPAGLRAGARGLPGAGHCRASATAGWRWGRS